MIPTPPLRDVVRRYEIGGSLSDGLLRPPLSSFGHGAAGVAYFLSRYAVLAGDSRPLRSARKWTAVAERNLGHREAFTGDSPVFADDRAAIPASLYFGEAGVWCVTVLGAAALGDTAGVDRGVERFVAVAEACPVDRLDATSGSAGLLLGAARMVEELGDPPPAPLAALGGRVADWLTRVAERVAQTTGPAGWLGAAHGWGGIAHALLRWSEATATPPAPEVEALLVALGQARLADGLWPRRTDAPEVWAGWCHGSAGWAQLWTLAWDVLGDPDALVLAEVAGADAVAIEDAGPGLCCGEGGAAYAALALFRATGDRAWLDHARRLGAHAAGAATGPSFPEHSLWQGDVGVALLIAELEDPSSATMPLYRRA